jgi:hypothetical protein
LRKSNRDDEAWHTMNVIRSPIQRIDNPSQSVIAAGDIGVFFRQKPMVRESVQDSFSNNFLRC